MNIKMQKVSIIIPAYNSAEYIKQAVDSALGQTYKNVEIVVVDDGSTDNTAGVLAPYIKENNIKYIHQENEGAGMARNKGINNSSGEIVAFLDADDIWMPDKLEKQIPLLSNPDIGVVYSDIEIFGDSFVALRHSEIASGFYRGNILKHLIKGNFIPTSSVVMRRSIFGIIDGFADNSRFYTVEDYEFWLRVATITKFDYVSDSLVKYRVHKDQLSGSRVKTHASLARLYKSLLVRRAFSPYLVSVFIQYIKSLLKYLYRKVF